MIKYCKYAIIVGITKGECKKQNNCKYLRQINENNDDRFVTMPKCPSDCLKNKDGYNSCYIIEEESDERS